MPEPSIRRADLFSMVGILLSTSSDAGTSIDVIASLLGHSWVSSSQVYVHPDPARLREAVARVSSPLAGAAVTR
jgi:integrase/recombinase XerD